MWILNDQEMKNNTERLLDEFKQVLLKQSIPDSEIYEKNLHAFLSQCPDDGMLAEAHLRWDEEEQELDVLWDTSNLDGRFSIGATDSRWRLWVGVNHHSKDDECFTHGVGGEEITEEGIFAMYFFDYMNDYWEDHKDYWNPYRET